MKLILGAMVLFLGSYSMANDDVVATCGSYKLIQNMSEGYFAGILHRQNTYEIFDGRERLPAQIEMNSEGATLKASKDLKVDERTGAVLDSEDLTITAYAAFGVNTFELTVSKNGNVVNKFPCVKK